MRVEDFYHTSWQALIVLLAWLVVSSSSVRPLIALPSYILAFLLVSRFGAAFREKAQEIRYLIYLALAALVVDQTVTFDDIDGVLSAMIEIVSLFLPFSLLWPERPRSYWFAILTVVVVAVGCMTFSSSIMVYVSFTLLILAITLNLNAANLALRDERGERTIDRLPKTYFRQFVLVMPAGLLGAAAIFFTFPRVQSFSLSLGNFSGRNQSGYSGVVDLDESGEIEESKALAFMVVGEDRGWLQANASTLLFRGNSLDSFDGRHWSNNVFDFKRLDAVADRRVSLKQAGFLQRLTIYAEPSLTNAVFYPGSLFSLTGDDKGEGGFLISSAGSVMRDNYEYERRSYALTVAPAVEAKDLPETAIDALKIDLQSSLTEAPSIAGLGPKTAALYLAVPDAVARAPYFAAWARAVGVDPAADGIAAALGKISGVFAASFKASLKNDFDTDDNLREFLAVKRTGHCEYFATATTLLLRSLGLPARVVVGYHGGTYNQYADVLEVREENGHAWVEVFVPRVGWLPFDPTPAAPDLLAENFTATLRLWSNAMGYYFRQYVVDYDYQTQREIAQSLRSLGNRRGEAEKQERVGWNRAVVTRVVAGAAICGALFVAFLWFRRRSRGADYPQYYRIFLRRLRRLGIERELGESLAVFHQRVRAQIGDAALLGDMHEAISRDLYARTGVAAETRRDLQERTRAESWRRRA
jgi:transglutaminase-like putative cysteine protease